jgi:hypothetical protein
MKGWFVESDLITVLEGLVETEDGRLETLGQLAGPAGVVRVVMGQDNGLDLGLERMQCGYDIF